MSEPRSGGPAAATAGMEMLGSIIACALAGYGLGWLLGLAVPLGLLGLFVGLVVGFILVHARFRRI
ncbi:MAG: hypothetical protein EXQ70_10525 [Solirubrobacterales bacterium]|nr:hypothetical protein [Solirubrobacterales bacterium]